MRIKEAIAKLLSIKLLFHNETRYGTGKIILLLFQKQSDHQVYVFNRVEELLQLGQTLRADNKILALFQIQILKVHFEYTCLSNIIKTKTFKYILY